MLIQLLVVDAQNIAGGLGYHRLLVAAIDCVWCAVVGSVINEDEFIQKQGIFALLDLIEVKEKKTVDSIRFDSILNVRFSRIRNHYKISFWVLFWI